MSRLKAVPKNAEYFIGRIAAACPVEAVALMRIIDGLREANKTAAKELKLARAVVKAVPRDGCSPGESFYDALTAYREFKGEK